ncbi:leucine-rich repeat-containing protein 74A-like [Elysia marginata]|uniref:Leucine-rich repeat-containing protein 74A-like n=1 Tax=Elysia marginata TaxID=1093978 RepID=A0AAV4HIJ4_9GAST|nr:leucine-rich repeat-containing protein 74A-like [Elysia marginata]
MLHRIRKWKHSNLKELDLEGVVVDKDFEPMLEDMQKERFFLVRYDTALMSERNAPTKVDPKNIFNIDPVRILFFMKQHLRTIDLFLKIDKDISGSLTKDEMRYAFQLEGYPISDQALDRVMGYLDTNNDGAVDLGEFYQGERRTKREMIREAMEKRQLLKSGELTQEGTQSQNTPDLDSAGLRTMAKYSQAFTKPKIQTQQGKPTLGKKTPTLTPGMSPRSNTFV